jgi:hypothetical protein
MVDEDAAHHTRGDRQEVCAILPRHILDVYEPQIGLVHEGGRLKTVTRTLVRHLPLRNLVELAMHKRDQLLKGAFIAFRPLQQQPGDLWRFVSDT